MGLAAPPTWNLQLPVVGPACLGRTSFIKFDLHLMPPPDPPNPATIVLSLPIEEQLRAMHASGRRDPRHLDFAEHGLSSP